MQRIRLKIKWGRAKTDSNGKITGWNDYVPGDVIEIEKKSNPLNATDYEVVIPERRQKEDLPMKTTRRK